jgi:hypothetical protein
VGTRVGQELEMFGAYYLTSVNGVKLLFCQWPHDSVFVLSTIDTPEA